MFNRILFKLNLIVNFVNKFLYEKHWSCYWKKNSVGVHGKNTRIILGRPAAEYAFIAGTSAGLDKIYVSTDCDKIAEIGRKYDATIIDRPPELALPESLTEDVLTHAYEIIKEDLNIDEKINTISLFSQIIQLSMLNY